MRERVGEKEREEEKGGGREGSEGVISRKKEEKRGETEGD